MSTLNNISLSVLDLSPVPSGSSSDLAQQAQVNEVMVTTMVYEHEARRQSYKLLADAFCIPV